ncbi:VOC family protein [Thioclava sp. GXIMD4215]|uniref:VOC family protein n=1 Tax=Thioclava sp. GXIMD4215 TaxID=3131928 RepID=UPI0032555D0E
MATSDAPIEVGHVTLTVHDLKSVGAFYENVLGLARLSSDGTVARYGADGRVLVELRADRAARKASHREAGLFHTAFLMPSRRALADWLDHAVARRAPLQGASDHSVSEAIYLADPEGNGVEVYVDRPRDQWIRMGDQIHMVTEPLDLQDLHNQRSGKWFGAPKGMTIGHVHLQVGGLAPAMEFYGKRLGLSVMNDYPGAKFFGWGGYHHHIATNIWNSRGAGAVSRPATGLSGLTLRGEAKALAALGGAATLVDPWGLPVTLKAKEMANAR